MSVPVTDPKANEDPASPHREYRDLIADCVHCGFCLPACPTYVSWGEEMDSPRGRIDLMKGVDDGTIPLDAVVAGHIDACLGCMGCVTACPSGVRYDLLIEATRARVEEAVPRSASDRAFRELVFSLFPYPKRLRALVPGVALGAKLGAARAAAGPLGKLLPARLRQLIAMAPPVGLRDVFARLPAKTPAKGARRARVALIAGCVQRAFFPNVNAATIRVLSAEGCDVIVPRGQGCCGALSLHSGRPDEAKRFARALIERFEKQRLDAIIINAAGCGSTLKEYGELFAGDETMRARAQSFAAKVRDVNEYLATLEPRAPRKPIALRVAYHDACHLAHAQRVRAQPRELLRTI
ncbi:MAG TPA: heterodisulfide reductase-related iron-sulfur binding cluster, partial [Candidatus Elarobacter sp.]